jgi:transposase
MIAFIDDHRGTYGVEPICRVLPIAPSTYHAHVAQRVDPAKISPRARQDLVLMEQIRRVHAANFAVYGARKVWRQLRREGIAVARCTVGRLMRRMGLRGVVRGKENRTTIADKASPCPADKAYDFPRCRRACHERRIVPRIARRGLDTSERLGRHRWVVERTFAWVARLRRLVVRYEQRADIFEAFHHLAAAMICCRFVERWFC